MGFLPEAMTSYLVASSHESVQTFHWWTFELSAMQFADFIYSQIKHMNKIPPHSKHPQTN